MLMLSDELIEEIADIAVAQTEADIAKNTKLPELVGKRDEVQKSIDNIATAIEKGVASDTLMSRLTDLEKQKKNLDRQIADEEKLIFRLDREQVIYWLSQFKDGDIEDESFRRQLIDLMVNSVTVWTLPDGDFEITTAYNLTSCKSKTFKASERFGFEGSSSTTSKQGSEVMCRRKRRHIDRLPCFSFPKPNPLRRASVLFCGGNPPPHGVRIFSSPSAYFFKTANGSWRFVSAWGFFSIASLEKRRFCDMICWGAGNAPIEAAKEDRAMSKYDPLWEYIRRNAPEVLTFDEVEAVCGFPIDHAFLTFKKELLPYGFRVGKISMKEKTIRIQKL